MDSYTIEEQERNRKRWIEALRGGKYEQERGLLRKYDRYSCLGVACNLFDSKAWDLVSEYLRWAGGTHAYDHASAEGISVEVLPTIVRDWLGLTTTDGAFAVYVGLHSTYQGDAGIASLFLAEINGMSV